MFLRLLRHFQGELFCMLKIIFTVCNYRGLHADIIHVFYCICAFIKKNCKEWQASRTNILYMGMCWIYSIILGLSRFATDFR